MCRRLFQWKQVSKSTASLTGTNYAWRKRFAEVISSVGLDGIDYRPHSLRRGGATYYFQMWGSFDKLLLLGRWQAAATARLYVNEGLSVLTELTIPWNAFNRNLRSQYLRSLTLELPKLDPDTKRTSSQSGGTWKHKQKRRKKGVSAGVTQGW